MRQIIDGKRYDTDTAEYLAGVPCHYQSRSDFNYEDTAIYRTKSGRYFIAGEGGPMTRWAHKAGNMWTNGSGIRPLSPEEARVHLEDANAQDALERYFAIEEA
jgi:hypothetical protein